jgi:hypothetical protein
MYKDVGMRTHIQWWLWGDPGISPNGVATDAIPGRWLGGASLILGPIVLLVGLLLRIQFNFFYPTSWPRFTSTRP